MLYRSQSFMGQKSWMKIWFYASTIFFFFAYPIVHDVVNSNIKMQLTIDNSKFGCFFFYLTANFEIYLDCGVVCKIDFELETNTFFAMIEKNTRRRLKNTQILMCALLNWQSSSLKCTFIRTIPSITHVYRIFIFYTLAVKYMYFINGHKDSTDIYTNTRTP